jgi:hypothetical protein
MIEEGRNEQIKKKRGRPPHDNARRKVNGIRFDAEEQAMIEHLEIETGMNMTDIIRKAVRTYYPIQINKL